MALSVWHLSVISLSPPHTCARLLRLPGLRYSVFSIVLLLLLFTIVISHFYVQAIDDGTDHDDDSNVISIPLEPTTPSPPAPAPSSHLFSAGALSPDEVGKFRTDDDEVDDVDKLPNIESSDTPTSSPDAVDDPLVKQMNDESLEACHKRCSGHGYCVDDNYCSCHDGYYGMYCELKTCPHPSISGRVIHSDMHPLGAECDGRGRCNSVTGICACPLGWIGVDCSMLDGVGGGPCHQVNYNDETYVPVSLPSDSPKHLDIVQYQSMTLALNKWVHSQDHFSVLGRHCDAVYSSLVIDGHALLLTLDEDSNYLYPAARWIVCPKNTLAFGIKLAKREVSSSSSAAPVHLHCAEPCVQDIDDLSTVEAKQRNSVVHGNVSHCVIVNLRTNMVKEFAHIVDIYVGASHGNPNDGWRSCPSSHPYLAGLRLLHKSTISWCDGSRCIQEALCCQINGYVVDVPAVASITALAWANARKFGIEDTVTYDDSHLAAMEANAEISLDRETLSMCSDHSTSFDQDHVKCFRSQARFINGFHVSAMSPTVARFRTWSHIDKIRVCGATRKMSKAEAISQRLSEENDVKTLEKEMIIEKEKEIERSTVAEIDDEKVRFTSDMIQICAAMGVVGIVILILKHMRGSAPRSVQVIKVSRGTGAAFSKRDKDGMDEPVRGRTRQRRAIIN